MTEKHGILIAGMNGAGKSTIARVFAGKYGYRYLDVEDFWFPHRKQGEAYHPVSKEEMEASLLSAVQAEGSFILASVKGDFSCEIQECFDLGVLVETDHDLRKERMIQRSEKLFGKEMTSGTELYAKEMKFIERMAERSDTDAMQWMIASGLAYVCVNGTDQPEDNAEKIMTFLKKQEQLERIRTMDALLDACRAEIQAGQYSEDLDTKMAQLMAYASSSDWMQDFEADEAGLLPKDLKRGVLSEDAVYELYESYQERE